MRLRNLRPLNRHGYALVLVLIFTSISLLIMSGALSWSNNNAILVQRYNQYYNTMAAAEAATEKVLADICTTYQKEGEGSVYSKLGTYATWVPTSAESSYWSGYEFNNGAHNVGQTTVTRVSAPAQTNLSAQFVGLYGVAANYKVISNARQLNAPFDITVALKQEAQVATIPVFQFAIFYSMDLEINPGADMKVTGRVHGNADIYATTSASLEFQSYVTAVGNINNYRKDNTNTISTNVLFDVPNKPHFNSLSLPIGTNNTPDAVYAILQVPPSTEDRYSAMGKQRYYNSADVIVLVSNSNVTITSGTVDNFATTLSGDTNWISTNGWSGSILNTNLTFTDLREAKTVLTTTLNVGNLLRWCTNATNAVKIALTNTLGRQIDSIYVADFRSTNSTTGAGILVTNGQNLLGPSGLTIATPDPLYVQGNYNAPAAYLGTTNTTTAQPASLVCDAINILSTAWNPANSTKTLSNRVAANTTVNAAIISGIVPTVGSTYSGGVENFPRFLEDWGSKTLTYNGSMVVMYNSHMATANWPGTGTVYNPPTRSWAFDLNYMDSTKLPPGTPQMRALVRCTWTTIPKDTTL